MGKFVLMVSAIAVLAVTTLAQPAAAPPTGPMQLFLLVGQSNMAGRGKVEPQDTVPIPRVLMLDRQGTWVPAVDPMHFDKPVAGVGLGRSFAARILTASQGRPLRPDSQAAPANPPSPANPGMTIGLIPAAVGGSPIDAWQPGVFYEPTKSHPWDDAIARARVAMASGTLRAILWHQGESDSTPDLAPGYEAKLHDLIARFRTALDAPDVPFIVGQLGQYPDVPWDASRRLVDAAHRALPGTVRRTAFVSSDGLVHGGDKVHFDTPSLRELGRRYADAYLSLSARP